MCWIEPAIVTSQRSGSLTFANELISKPRGTTPNQSAPLFVEAFHCAKIAIDQFNHPRIDFASPGYFKFVFDGDPSIFRCLLNYL
ncbi:hypothetical protein AEYBE204_02345 [Asticcacaulis sp. YBE204]|nr:hypothetical protein AEYBE204_02345 [Asticcacaulis sp. YBE204]